MATAAKHFTGDRWVQIRTTWEAYLRLERARRDKCYPKLIYYRGRLTIVSPGTPHERYRSRLSSVIEGLLVALDIDFVPSGSFTLKQAGPPSRGVEGDLSYYLRDPASIRAKYDLEMGVDPPPDLQVEVVISHPVRDALRAHANFGVPEVWVCKANGLTFLLLGEDGRYHPSKTSACLPFLSPDEIAEWVLNAAPCPEPAFRRAIRDWAIATVAPRLRQGGPNP